MDFLNPKEYTELRIIIDRPAPRHYPPKLGIDPHSAVLQHRDRLKNNFVEIK